MKKQIAFILVAMSHSYVQAMDNSVPVVLSPRSHARVRSYIIDIVGAIPKFRDAVNTGHVEMRKRMVDDPDKREYTLSAEQHEGFIRYDVTVVSQATSVKKIEYHATLTWADQDGTEIKLCARIPNDIAIQNSARTEVE